MDKREKWEKVNYDVDAMRNTFINSIRPIFSSPKTIQATVTLLENLHIILEKNLQPDLLINDILPMLQNAFESTTQQVQVCHFTDK